MPCWPSCSFFFTTSVRNGAGAVSWEFLTQPPRRGMTEGGIFPAIIGTFIVTIVTAVLAIPLGMFAAIYLNEYARQSRLTRLIRLSIRNLSGVPSIVYGLFGVILFVNVLKFGTSILSAGLTLGLLTLPWTITASEEALKTVPELLPRGSPGPGGHEMAGHPDQRAALRRAGNADRAPSSDWPGPRARRRPIHVHGCGFLSPVPPQILCATSSWPCPIISISWPPSTTPSQQVRPLAYGTALVLIVLVLGMNLTAVIIRYRLRRKRRW